MLKYFYPLFLTFFLVTTNYAQPETDTTKRVKFAGIPIVNYSTTLGFSVGALAQAYYHVNPDDTISPVSSTGVFGMYTTNHTYFSGAFQSLYLREDTWRIMFGAGFGNVNFQYWQSLPIFDGFFIGFSTKATFGLLRVERRVFGELYAGINTVFARTETTYDLPEVIPDSIRIDKRSMNNLGYQFNYDKRDNQINPFEGYHISFKNSFYREWMGSGNDFQTFTIVYNHYYKLRTPEKILATRVKASISLGDVPFQGQNVVGQDDIRGYSEGKYRDNQVYAIQTEYRWRFYKKFGMVAFFGLACAVEKAGDIFSSEILPGGGMGIRYMLIPEERINIGFDAALGKDDWGIYFRIGEAFGR